MESLVYGIRRNGGGRHEGKYAWTNGFLNFKNLPAGEWEFYVLQRSSPKHQGNMRYGVQTLAVTEAIQWL